MFEAISIVLFVRVSVVALPTSVSVASGNVSVRSAVGSPAESVSSKSSAVEPSIVIVEENTPIFVMSERFPVVITVPATSGNVIVLSAVGFVTVKVVSNSLSVAPSTIIDAPGTTTFLLASSAATPLIAPFCVSGT